MPPSPDQPSPDDDDDDDGPPPIVRQPQAEPARYVEWMAKQQTPVTDTATEAVELRIGDWGFFSHGGAPGQSADRTALDRSGHAVRPKVGDWYELLTASGLDGKGAMERAVWLYSGALYLPGQVAKFPNVKAPTLTLAGDTITATGFVGFPPGMQAQLMTVTATRGTDGAVVVFDDP